MTKCLRSTIENVKQLLRNCRFGATAARVLRTACWVLLTACSSHTDFNSWKMYGGNAQVDYLRKIGAQTLYEPYGVSTDGDLMVTIWARLPA